MLPIWLDELSFRVTSAAEANVVVGAGSGRPGVAVVGGDQFAVLAIKPTAAPVDPVFLAKEGHDNPVGINLLEKVQMPNLASLYGAMLAGVDFVIMGAGIPIQIGGVLDKHAEHQPTSYRLDVLGAQPAIAVIARGSAI